MVIIIPTNQPSGCLASRRRSGHLWKNTPLGTLSATERILPVPRARLETLTVYSINTVSLSHADAWSGLDLCSCTNMRMNSQARLRKCNPQTTVGAFQRVFEHISFTTGMCVVVFFNFSGLALTLVCHIIFLLVVSADKRVIPVSCWERVYLLLTRST